MLTPTATSLQPTFQGLQPTAPAFGNPYLFTPSSFNSPGLTPGSAAALSAAGIPASPEMEFAEAQRQSQLALSKLAAVNPDLAEQLAAQQPGGTPQGYEGDDGGVFGFIKKVGGALLAPALSWGGKALDFIGRTSHIVPQWFDPDDEGNFITDIGQAMSGEDKTNWNEVFQHWGWDDGGTGWLRAIAGFAGDVATDPLTYATFGAGAGLSASERAASGARMAFTRLGEKELAPLAGRLGWADDAVGHLLTNAWGKAAGFSDNIATIKQFVDQGAEEMLGLVGREAQGEVRSIMGDLFEAGSAVYDMNYSRTFKNFLNRGQTLKMTNGMELNGSQLKSLYEGIVKNGTFSAYGDAAWGAGKAAAAQAGGLRFRFALPFTNLRYITPMVPQSYRLGLGTLSRFGSGLSATKALTGEVTAGRLPAEGLRMFFEKGWDGVQELAGSGDAVARQIVDVASAGRAPFIRDAFWSASETAGRFTGHFTPGAKTFRRGLGYYFYRNGLKGAASLRQRLTDDLFYSIVDDKRGAEVRTELYGRYKQQFGKATPDNLYDARLYGDYFGGTPEIPTSAADVQAGKLDDWFWNSTPDRRAAALDGVDVQKHTAVLNDMKRVLGSISGEQRRVLDDLTATQAYGKRTLERHGVEVGDTRTNLDERGSIHPGDVTLLGERPDHLSGTFYMKRPASVTASDARFSGVTKDFVLDNDDLGVAGHRIDFDGEGGPGYEPVILNVRNVMDVDLGDLENAAPYKDVSSVVDGSASFGEILAAVDKSLDDAASELGSKLHPLMDDVSVRTAWEDSTRGQLVADALKSRVDKPEAVRFFRDGKPVSMVLLDDGRRRAWRLTNNTPIQQFRSGYFGRTLDPVVRGLLKGEGVKNEARFFGTPGELELKFRRETREMTLPEAETYVRNALESGRYGDIKLNPNQPIFDRDILRSHEDYIDTLGDAYFSHAMGRMTQRMLELGNLVPNTFAGVATSARTRFQMPTSRMRDLVRADKGVRQAYFKLQGRMDDLDERTASGYLEAHNRTALTLAYLDQGLTAEDIPQSALSTSVDEVIRSAARLEEVVADETRRLTARKAVLDQESAVTRGVEEQMHVGEFSELDEFIASKKHGVESEGLEDIGFLTDRVARRVELRIEQAGRIPTAGAGRGNYEVADMGNGIIRVKVNDSFLSADGTGFDYVKVVDGKVVAIRQTDGAGYAIAQTQKSQTGKGYGYELLRQHWLDQGVTDIAGVKRMVSANEYSDLGIKLNQRAARNYLAEHGFPPPEYVNDWMEQGKLFVGKDGSIITKKGAVRKAGRKVLPRSRIESELAELETLRIDLDDLRESQLVPEGASEAGGITSRLTNAEEAAAQDDFAAQLARLSGMGTEEAPTVSRQATRASRRYGSAVGRLESAATRTLKTAERGAGRRGETVGRASERLTLAQSEMGRRIAELKGAWAEMKPAAYFGEAPAGGKLGYRQVQVPGMSGVFLHPYVAEEVEHLFRGKVPGHLSGLWRKFLLGPWKRWATYRNPGFHIRNFFGAWFNNTIGGVDNLDHEFSRLVNMARGDKGGWWAKPISSAHWNRYNFSNLPGMNGLRGKLTYGQVSEMLADIGIGRANTTSIAKTMGGEALTYKKGGAVRTFLHGVDRNLKNAGGLTEDFFRVAAWAGGMRHLEGDLYGARAFTMLRHGDYSDLTETEDWVRDLVPFYKWMRTNIPYQFRMLAENPGLMTALIDKGENFAYAVQGLNRDEIESRQPEWVRRGFNIPIPKGVPFIGGDGEQNYLMADLPYSDLYNGLRDYLSAGLPVIRNIVESFGIQQSVFTGAPLGEKMVPLSGLWAAPGIREVVSALPWAQKGPDGQVYIPDTIDNVLAAVPQYSRFRNWMLAEPERVQNRTSTFTSALLGFRLMQDDQTDAELSFYYDELLPAMDRLRSMGYEFPTADQLASAGQAVTSYGLQPDPEEFFPTGVMGSIAPGGEG